MLSFFLASRERLKILLALISSTGTLIEVGEGKRKASEMENILRAESREPAGFTAPSRGLFLREVYYENWKGGADA